MPVIDTKANCVLRAEYSLFRNSPYVANVEIHDVRDSIKIEYGVVKPFRYVVNNGYLKTSPLTS